MTEQEKRILEDMKGFIDFGLEMGKPLGWILANIGHDITGLLHDQGSFSPRTSGYANWRKVESNS